MTLKRYQNDFGDQQQIQGSNIGKAKYAVLGITSAIGFWGLMQNTDTNLLGNYAPSITAYASTATATQQASQTTVNTDANKTQASTPVATTTAVATNSVTPNNTTSTSSAASTNTNTTSSTATQRSAVTSASQANVTTSTSNTTQVATSAKLQTTAQKQATVMSKGLAKAAQDGKIVKFKKIQPTSISITLGSIEKVAGDTSYAEVPSVKLSGGTNLKTPSFDASDFDWSTVGTTAGDYRIGLNEAGVAKIAALNAYSTFNWYGSQMGYVKVVAPVQHAIYATIGDITKVYDGNNKFNGVPQVQIGGDVSLTMPTLTNADFDWTQVGKNAGTYYVSLNVNGIRKIQNSNPNTYLNWPAITMGHATITKRTVHIDAGFVGKNFKEVGEKDPEMAVSVYPTGIQGDDITYDIQREAGETPGRYKMLNNTKPEDNPNYNLVLDENNFYILGYYYYSIGPVSKVYDGTSKLDEAPSVTVSVSGGGGLTEQVPGLTPDDFVIGNAPLHSLYGVVHLTDEGERKVDGYFSQRFVNALFAPTFERVFVKPTFYQAPISAQLGNMDLATFKQAKATNSTSVSLPSVTLSGMTDLVLPELDWSCFDIISGHLALSQEGIDRINKSNPNEYLNWNTVVMGQLTTK